MSLKMDKESILLKNPQVNKERVAEYLAFQEQMKASGVTVDSGYRIASALGGLGASKLQGSGASKLTAQARQKGG